MSSLVTGIALSCSAMVLRCVAISSLRLSVATGALLGVPRSRVHLRHLQYSIGTSATKVKAVARQVASELEQPRVRALLADVARCDREVWREAVALHPQMLARLWSGTLPWDRDVSVRDS